MTTVMSSVVCWRAYTSEWETKFVLENYQNQERRVDYMQLLPAEKCVMPHHERLFRVTLFQHLE